MNRLTKGKALVGALSIDAQDITISDDLVVGDATTTVSLAINGGTVIKKFASGTAAVDLAEIAAGTTGSGTFTVTGAAVGDTVFVNPPALTTGLAFAGAAVTGANTVTVYAVNATASPIDQAEATFRYTWFDLT